MNKDIITPEQLEIFINISRARLAVAVFILLGMVAVGLGTLCMAFGFRKTGFVFMGIYGSLMSFIGVGFCYIFGPFVLLASIGGLAREWIKAPQKSA